MTGKNDPLKARLAAALRDNLRKRKAQARQSQPEPPEDRDDKA